MVVLVISVTPPVLGWGGVHSTLSSLSIYVLPRDARPKYKGKGLPITCLAGSRYGWVTNATSQPLYPQSKSPGTHCAQWVPGCITFGGQNVWSGRVWRRCLDLTGVRTPKYPVHSLVNIVTTLWRPHKTSQQEKLQFCVR